MKLKRPQPISRCLRKLFALLLATLLAVASGTTLAAETGHSGGHSGGGHAGGPGTTHGGGHDLIGHDSDHGDAGSQGSRGMRRGKGAGRHASSDIHQGGHDSGRRVENTIFRGGRPVWAREGILEVELGRLNMGRVPTLVLARALDEAALRYDPETMSTFYGLDAESAATLLESDYANVVRLDSPQQNLALYRDVMMDFPQPLLSGLQPASQLDLAAIYLGSAADKAIPITEESVIAINRILGLVPLEANDQAVLALKADTVRIGLATGHGPDSGH